VTYEYDLTLGLPHTNHRFLSEHHLLKYAGHFQWNSIAAAAGMPLSALRTTTGGEVYASFYYIEVRIPDAAPLESFRLDDRVRFAIALRAFKNIAIEGRIRFDKSERLGADSPFIHFANIFITPEKGNSRLRVAPPAQADFASLPLLPNDENPFQLTRAAEQSGALGVIDDSWTSIGTYEHRYTIDVDRDTNGAGLVYFANYVAFMDTAERLALRNLGIDARSRSLRHRRIAYYGNADVEDTITIHVEVLRNDAHLGFRFRLVRDEDGQMICLSEAIKAL
jgi:probable biosynthetic protein (TIGR04098 family)